MMTIRKTHLKYAHIWAVLLLVGAGLSGCSYFHPELEVSSDDLDESELQSTALQTDQNIDLPHMISRSTDGRVTLYNLDQAYDPMTGQVHDVAPEDLQYMAPAQAHAVPGSMMPEDVYRMRGNDSVYLYPLQ